MNPTYKTYVCAFSSSLTIYFIPMLTFYEKAIQSSSMATFIRIRQGSQHMQYMDSSIMADDMYIPYIFT